MSGLSRRPKPLSPPLQPADITLVFDGGSLGNPGKGYGSFVYQGVITTPSPVRLEFPGQTTNNEAEYMTMLHGLRTVLRELERDARDPSALTINVLSDSKLVVEQVSGRWKVRHAPLRPFQSEARDLFSRFAAWQLVWQPRLESVRLLGH
ncbi:MAG TPA: reverse transcriptase-like protein [Thermomicrobiales bacterium]|nr:reverse transcriptase-like protein [Thermomicrobiales bacterium]